MYISDKPKAGVKVGVEDRKAIRVDIKVLFLMEVPLANLFLPAEEKLRQIH